jgi:hypothetical protein
MNLSEHLRLYNELFSGEWCWYINILIFEYDEY